MTAQGVRRDKAALSSGCKAHPAIRSSRKQSEQSWRALSRRTPKPAVRCGKPARGQIDPGAPFGNTAGLDFRIVIARLPPVSDFAYEGQNDSSRRVNGCKGKDTSGYPTAKHRR